MTVAARPLRVHVVYEYAADFRPHASAHLRLLRPLGHPALGVPWHVTFDSDYDVRPGADVVIVDRLWRPDINPALADALTARVRRSGARLLYALDDNLLDLVGERSDWLTPDHIAVLEGWLAEADGLLLTTEALAERYRGHNANVAVVPNALDERLLGGTQAPLHESPFGPRPLVIGYMGTTTHDADLALILPALRDVCAAHPGAVRLELVGVAGNADTVTALADLPVRWVAPNAHEREYPLFALWFTTSVHWDIAVSPLRDTPFNRSKSDVKHLDYAALGAAAVLSRVPAYADTVCDGQTGLLVENTVAAWRDALERLVRDDGLREALAVGAARYLYRERVLATCAPRWAEAIGALLGPSVGDATGGSGLAQSAPGT